MRVLVACEYSGIVRQAFEHNGWDAWSCDLLDTEITGNHYKGDVRDILISGWDLLIAHPPCTYLCNSGVRWLYNKDKKINIERWTLMEQGAAFFLNCLNAPVKHICVENPVMHKHAKKIIGVKQTQVIQPWMFGHGETKATCLWLKGLPALQHTSIVSGREQKIWKLPPSADRWKERSKTYTGIALAMAEQWTEYFLLK